MATEASLPEQQGSKWDPLVANLQALREQNRDPSFGAIADMIQARRESEGMHPGAARIARSTVYDTFRMGRRRINLDLVHEIGVVLGAEADTVQSWIDQCRRVPEVVEEVRSTRTREVVTLMVACVAISMLGRLIVDFLHLPIYLDMVGTAIAAIALGAWRGALVGGVTNFVSVLMSGWVSTPFALVNIAGALVWGYGVHRFGMGRTLPRFLALNVIAAVVCSIVAVPILVFMFGGSVEQGQDTVTQTFLDLGNGLLAAVGFSNLLTSGIDKVISGFVALVVVTALPWHMRRGIPLVMADHR